jgi:hypothetical protein
LPIPPSTAAVNALIPGTNPLKKKICRNMSAYSTPAAPAIAAPRAKVVTMARFTSMPIRAAVLLSSDTARIAVPAFERITNRYSPVIMARAETMTSASTQRMVIRGRGIRSDRTETLGYA